MLALTVNTKQLNAPGTASSISIPESLDPSAFGQFLQTEAVFLSLVVLVLTAVIAAGGFQHRSVTWLFLAEPRRARAYVAGAVTGALVGLVLSVVVTAIALLVRSGKPLGIGIGHLYLSVVVLGILTGGFGYAIGMAMRSTTAAVGWLVFVGFVLPLGFSMERQLDSIAKFLPYGEQSSASSALAQAYETEGAQLRPVTGGLVLAGWTALALAAGFVRTRQDL